MLNSFIKTNKVWGKKSARTETTVTMLRKLSLARLTEKLEILLHLARFERLLAHTCVWEAFRGHGMQWSFFLPLCEKGIVKKPRKPVTIQLKKWIARDVQSDQCHPHTNNWCQQHITIWKKKNEEHLKPEISYSRLCSQAQQCMCFIKPCFVKQC